MFFVLSLIIIIVIKRDVVIAIANVEYWCFFQDRLGNAKSNVGTACRKDLGATP